MNGALTQVYSVSHNSALTLPPHPQTEHGYSYPGHHLSLHHPCIQQIIFHHFHYFNHDPIASHVFLSHPILLS